MIRTIDARQTRLLLRAIIRQYPFALKNAMNRTILEMQRFQRFHQRRVFEIRRPRYWEQSVKIPKGGFATVKRLEATMIVDPKGKTPKFDIWRRQEYGGPRVPILGRKKLAIPPDEASQLSPVGLTRTSTGVIPSRLRPKNLKRTFTVPFKSGVSGLFRRLGSRQKGFVKTAPGQRFGLRDDPNVELMYILAETADVEAVYEFFTNAKRTYDSKFNRYFNDELVKAFKTARLPSR